jgi:hypothetical protein
MFHPYLCRQAGVPLKIIKKQTDEREINAEKSSISILI